MIYELTEIDYDILNSIYFVEPFDKILEEVNYPPNVVADCLKSLISKKYVVALLWDDTKQDYVRSFMYDSDNMNAYSYLATKDGLLAHNSQV